MVIDYIKSRYLNQGNCFTTTSYTSSVKQRKKNGYYAVQGHSSHRFWYQSKAHIRLPISN